MSRNQRVDWVDIAKGISILAVVLLHTDFTFPKSTLMPIQALVGAGWHVAVFFLIGGFFLREEKLVYPIRFVSGKFKSLYLLASYFYIPAVILHNSMFVLGWYSADISYGGKYISEFTPPLFLKSLIQTVLCAGREPILGAVWFVYVLFFAMCGLSVSSWVVDLVVRNKEVKQKVFPVFLLSLCVISCTMTRDLGFNIPRFNNTFTAMWLIYVGYWLKNKAKWEFDNVWMFLGSGILFIHFCMTYPAGMALNANKFADVISLTVGTVSTLYVICYISVKLQGCLLGNMLKKCGEESFYIMALQFVGFKIGCYLLNIIGFSLPIAQLLAPTGNKFYLVIYFVVMGALFPIAFMSCFRFVKANVLRVIK